MYSPVQTDAALLTESSAPNRGTAVARALLQAIQLSIACPRCRQNHRDIADSHQTAGPPDGILEDFRCRELRTDRASGQLRTRHHTCGDAQTASEERPDHPLKAFHQALRHARRRKKDLGLPFDLGANKSRRPSVLLGAVLFRRCVRCLRPERRPQTGLLVLGCVGKGLRPMSLPASEPLEVMKPRCEARGLG